MAVYVFPDNTVLCNFAAVQRCGLLAEALDGRGRWVEAVAFEAERSRRHLPDLAVIVDAAVFGEPITISGRDAVRRVEAVRRAVFGGVPQRPLQHLGEAQTQYVLSEDPQFKDSIWVTDDRDAYDFGWRKRFITWETSDLVEEMVANGLLAALEAMPLLEAMRDQGRGVRLPRRPGWPR